MCHYRGGQTELQHIATVTDGVSEPTSVALFNGKKVVAFQITRAKGASELEVADAVASKVTELQQQHPHIIFNQAYDNTAPVRENYNGSMMMLYEGAILAVLVVFWFLKDWRATIVAATALPLSVIPTFAAMYLLGFSINLLTLLSLALVVGILVDDAIVEVENIMRHLQMGKTPMQAAMEAADEIGLAVIATTFTLIAVFLPTGFMDGVAGQFFRQFGLTTAVAVFISLLVARLLTPMMAAYLLKPNVHPQQDGWLMHKYLYLASWCQLHRKTTMYGAFLFLLSSLLLVPFMPTGFVPAADPAQTQVTMELPPGKRLEDTLQLALLAQQQLADIQDVTEVFISVGITKAGGSGPGQATSGSDVRKASFVINLTARADRDVHQSVVERQIRERLLTIPGARFSVGGVNSGESVQITLTGEDSELLYASTKALEQDLKKIPNIGSVSSGLSLETPEVQIVPDLNKASALGVTNQSLATALRFATFGDYSQNLAKLYLPQRQIPIRLKLEDKQRATLDELSQIPVRTATGITTLGNIAHISLGTDVSSIARLDRVRQTTTKIELGGRTTGEVMQQIEALPSLTSLPPGVQRTESGEIEQMNELFSSFGSAMLIGLLCIYMVLVLLFHDFMQPVTILAALPLSIGGALVALLLTKNSLSLPSIIGVIMLMGVVTKNSILLVEYSILARKNLGMSRYDALMDACHKRARPIVMTTIAMGFGMLPTAIGIGADPSFRGPMAIVVIGGLITSTFLSLLVIPVIFSYVDDCMEWLKRLVTTTKT